MHIYACGTVGSKKVDTGYIELNIELTLLTAFGSAPESMSNCNNSLFPALEACKRGVRS